MFYCSVIPGGGGNDTADNWLKGMDRNLKWKPSRADSVRDIRPCWWSANTDCNNARNWRHWPHGPPYEYLTTTNVNIGMIQWLPSALLPEAMRMVKAQVMWTTLAWLKTCRTQSPDAHHRRMKVADHLQTGIRISPQLRFNTAAEPLDAHNPL